MYLVKKDRKKEAVDMHDNREQWLRARSGLIHALGSLGFPEDLGNAIARHLGSPKAIERMTAYLNYVKPKNVELVVDEMLAIRSEIDVWREKKAAQEANEAYNRMLYNGLEMKEEILDGIS